MLAAMPQPPSAASRDEPVIRERGDACPGALRLHAADDGYLARVRIPGGVLTAHQASLLAVAADRFGDGHLELTSRGNVQLRGLAEGCGGGLAALLAAAGLLPAPSHERVRNIVATPMSAGVVPWVQELDRLLCANARVTALSGRFLFAFDDGRGDVAALEPDVTVLGETGEQAGQRVGERVGERVLVRLGAGAGAVAVAAQDGPRAALLAAEYFLDRADAAGTRAWRVSELPAEHALDDGEFAARLGAAGIDGVRVAEVVWPYSPPPRPQAGGTGLRGTLCVLPPLGRLTTDQWRVIVQVADRGDGMRITPWRTIVLPGAPVRRPINGPARLEAAGLALSPDSAWRSVTACTGRPGCAKSLADVRADARALVERTRGPLPVHWSGCARRCGHPRGTEWVDVLATREDAYEISVRGVAVPHDPSDMAAGLTAARNAYPSEPLRVQDAVKK